MKIRCSAAVAALATLSCGPAHATLVGRDCDANGINCLAVYDTVANLTWDGNLSDSGVARNRADSIAWAAGVTIDSFSDWYLPTYAQYASLYAYGAPTSTDGYGSALFAGSLANFYFSPSASRVTKLWTGDPNPYLTVGLQDYFFTINIYWDNGFAGINAGGSLADNVYGALAVRDGDVAPAVAAVSVVPEPSSVSLVFAGLAGLMGLGRKARRRTMSAIIGR